MTFTSTSASKDLSCANKRVSGLINYSKFMIKKHENIPDFTDLNYV